MASSPRKRASSPSEPDERSSKRLRTASISAKFDVELLEMPYRTRENLLTTSARLSEGEMNRSALQRSIALALDHVGFDSSRKDALESMTSMADEYIQSLVAEIQFSAETSRRTQPTPRDFEKALTTFNLHLADLKPHRRNPVKKSKLVPTYYDPEADLEEFGNPLPCIGPELSGKADKESRAYIPQSFPDFPSIHTYKYTPIDAASVTVKGTGMRYDDGTSMAGAEQSPEDGLYEIRGNPQKTREAAAKQAKHAEQALLGLVRASKKNALNEARAAAERNALSKQRYGVWESTMRDLLEDPDMANGGAQAGGEQARVAIAEQCMMVNADKQYHRKEIQRLAKTRTQKA